MTVPPMLGHHITAMSTGGTDSGASSSAYSSPPSSQGSPRSTAGGEHAPPPAPPPLDLLADSRATSRHSAEEDYEREYLSTTSDSYDSGTEAHAGSRAGASVGRGTGAQPGLGARTPSQAAVQIAHWASSATDDGYWSSRANSPQPQAETPYWSDYGYASPQPNAFLYHTSISRNRSRNGSGATTPTHGYDKERAVHDYHSHHHQTSALLRKLGGSLTPDQSPVLGHKKRKPGWWATRAQTRRRNSNASAAPLGAPSTLPSKSGRNKSCLSTFGSALLRQPWVPTQPLTILFCFVLFGCFAATLTTFLVHVLSSDREPLPWRQFCQEQRPFPHALADSLKPVSVFVGVFSVDASVERRNMIRQTWAKHTKPIDPRTGRPTQDIQVKFILGKPRKSWSRRVALEMEMYNDVVVLDIDENMNKGKTFRYFEWANDNATVPVYYRTNQASVGVGFKKADYVVKADEDTFPVLSELERHLRITPRERTYWGYLVRNLFMAGELYALSSDLVQYIATYEPLRQYRIGKEDQRVAKWMRMHPEYATIHWISERCWIYDAPKAGTTYSHGYLFPDEVERIRIEGRRGITEEERVRRGGELAASYSTVSKWKHEYTVPASGLAIDEQVEALVEGGGRWTTSGWRSDYGKGSQALSRDKVVFEKTDKRLVDGRLADVATEPDRDATGVKPGVPDRSINLPTARTTRFGKDLFRDPSDVEAVQIGDGDSSRKAKRDVGGDGDWVEIHNAVKAPWEFVQKSDKAAPSSAFSLNTSSSSSNTLENAGASLESSSSIAPASSATASEDGASPDPTSAPVENVPTGAVKRPMHNYILPVSSAERFVPPPTLRYDSASMQLRQDRMLGLPHGGTVAVHYLKRNEWFYETALALLGREKLWDGGVDSVAHPWHASTGAVVVSDEALLDTQVSAVPPWTGSGNVQVVDAYWGGARMYGSPVVRDDGFVSEGRPAEARREVVRNVPNTALGGRLGRSRASPMFGLALEDGVEVQIGDGSAAQKDGAAEHDSSPGLMVQPGAAAVVAP